MPNAHCPPRVSGSICVEGWRRRRTVSVVGSHPKNCSPFYCAGISIRYSHARIHLSAPIRLLHDPPILHHRRCPASIAQNLFVGTCLCCNLASWHTHLCSSLRPQAPLLRRLVTIKSAQPGFELSWWSLESWSLTFLLLLVS